MNSVLGTLSRDKARWIVAGLSLASLVARSEYLLLGPGPDAPLGQDEPGYHNVAATFVNGQGWVDAASNTRSYRVPVVPGLLIVAYAIAGTAAPAIGRWTMVVVSSLVAPLLFVIVRSIFTDREEIALPTVGTWAFYPLSVFYVGLIVSESVTSGCCGLQSVRMARKGLSRRWMPLRLSASMGCPRFWSNGYRLTRPQWTTWC